MLKRHTEELQLEIAELKPKLEKALDRIKEAEIKKEEEVE